MFFSGQTAPSEAKNVPFLIFFNIWYKTGLMQKSLENKTVTPISVCTDVSGGCEAVAFEWHIDGRGSRAACQESRR